MAYKRTGKTSVVISEAVLRHKATGIKAFWKPLVKELNEIFNVNRNEDFWKNQYYKYCKNINNLQSSDKELNNLHKEDDNVINVSNGGNTARARVKRTSKELEISPMKMTPDKIIELFDMDPLVWEMVEYTIKFWETAMKIETRKDIIKTLKHNETTHTVSDSRGKTDKNVKGEKETKFTIKDQDPIKVLNYSIAAKFKRITEFKITGDNIEDLIKEIFNNKIVRSKPPKYKVKKEEGLTGNLLALLLFDSHLGKLAWRGESGTNYDITIAADIYYQLAVDIINRGNIIGFDRILIPFGNDFYQFDHDNKTTKGTPVPVESRAPKMFIVGVRLIIDVIDYAKKFAPVDLVYVPSNHDKNTAHHAYVTLHYAYRNDPRVTIIDHDTVNPRVYYKYGDTLIVFLHGDGITDKNLIIKIYQEAMKKFGGGWKFIVVFKGHVHHKISDSMPGVSIETVQSTGPTDAYENDHGWGGLPGGQGVLFNLTQKGILATLFSTYDCLSKDLTERMFK